MLIATAAVGLVAGCGGDDNVRSTTESGGDVVEGQLTATLKGSVLDTNSSPIEGATVGVVSGETTETDAQGRWTLEDVPVVNVQNNSDTPCAGNGGESNSGANGGCTGRPLMVTVTADGYLGGHTFVTPEGQFVSSQNAGSSGSQTNPSIGVFDGFAVEADPITLPELGAAIRIEVLNAETGQPLPNDVGLTLDFDQVTSDRTDESSFGRNFQAELDVPGGADDEAPGFFVFSGLAADSTFNLQAEGYDFDSCELIETAGISQTGGDGDGSSAMRTATVQLTAKSVATNAGDTCLIRSKDVGFTVDYRNARAKLLGPTSDDVSPYLSGVTGVFNNLPLSACQNCDSPSQGTPLNDVPHGQLTEGVNQSFTFQYSEGLTTLSAEDVLVYNVSTSSYIDLAAADGLVQNGDSVTINLADPLPNGTFFRVYLLTPGHRDLANNPLSDRPSTNQDDPVAFDLAVNPADCNGSGCLNTSFVSVNLCTFFRPATDPNAPQNANQERFDPRLAGDSNDWPINQGRSSSFNDVRDGGEGAFDDTIADGPIQQFNAPGQLDTPDLLGELAYAFGEDNPAGSIGEVDTDVARVEFDPVDGFDTYRITVSNESGSETFTTSAFANGSYASVSGSGSLSIGNAETTAVSRDGDLRFAFIYESAQPGDTVTVAAIDDLGNPGAASASVTIVDNVEPTTVLQRSYNDLMVYANENVGGCVVRPVPFANDVEFAGPPFTADRFIHAGIESEGGTDNVGSGGEVTAGGTPDVVGNVCLGVSPHLWISLSDTDGNISTAHNELVAGRDSDLSDGLDDISTTNPYFAEIYDDEAFVDWPVMARQVGSGDDSQGGLGIAFSERLADLGNPSVSINGGATLSNFAIQNDTMQGPTINSIVRPDVENLVRVTVNDALALANTGAGGILDFTGIVDENGVTATGDAAAQVVIRDQMAPYMTDAFRLRNGNLVFRFNEPIVVENGDVLSFSNAAGGTATFTFAGPSSDPINYSVSTDGTTITIDSGDVPTSIGALLGTTTLVYDDEAPVDTDLADQDTVTDAAHLVVDWRTISDQAGNSWQVYVRSFADGSPFADDVPGFALVDAIGPFEVPVQTSGFEAGSGMFTVTYSPTHPIFLASGSGAMCSNGAPAGFLSAGMDGNGTLDQADFTFTGFVVEEFMVNSQTPTNISFTVDVDGDLDGGEEINNNFNAVSTLICGEMGDSVNPPIQTADMP